MHTRLFICNPDFSSFKTFTMSKKTYLLIAGMLVLLLSFNNKANAQSHIDSHNYIDSCGGLGIFYVTATGDTSTYLETSYGDGTVDTSHGWGGGTTTVYYGAYHNYTSAGTY